MAEERCRGTVVRFDENRGFGFIRPDDGSEDLFVHHSSIQSDGYRSLQQGQSVEFFVVLEGDRTKAVDVSPLGSAPARRGGCFGCGEEGHIARECPRGSGGGRLRSGGGIGIGGGCFSCGLHGHIVRDCDQSGGRGGGGSGGGGVGGCFSCGLRGHLARDCEQSGGRGGVGGGGCFSCGGMGHLARECPSGEAGGGGRFGGGGGGGGKCYNCGEAGHFARECTGIRG